MPVNLYYTQRVRGFQQDSGKYTGESATFLLRRTKQRCPRCGSVDVVATPLRRRSIRGEPLGCCREVRMEFTIHRFTAAAGEDGMYSGRYAHCGFWLLRLH